MAPVELGNLSSNWKKLQKTLPAPTKSQPAEKNKGSSLKRKRATEANEGHSEKPSDRAAKKIQRKKQGFHTKRKMEEPAIVGASPKHHNNKTLTRSVSMPSLKQSSILASSKKDAESPSVLTPSADFPDVENEGMSPVVLPAKYIALDCEMVGTGPEPDKDSALARISVVDFHGHQVYDSYVQPTVDVTDCRTAVSGIELRHLLPEVARPFKEVREDIEILLDGRILVGHAVKNDLKVLQLQHDKRNIRDTSKYSKFRKLSMIPGRTPSLKILAEKVLGVEIQVGAHSSVEDARATMALFRLEKQGFDAEVIAKYGNIRVDVNKPATVDVGDGEPVKSKNKKSKRRRRKH